MTTIAIVPDNPKSSSACFRAVAGETQSIGATAGQALDALQAQLDGPDQTTLIVIQPMQPDEPADLPTLVEAGCATRNRPPQIARGT